MMHRRLFLSSVLAAGVLDRSRLSAITDEIAVSHEDAIGFCRQYGLRWVELRNVPGTKRGHWDAPLSEQREIATRLRDAGLGVSFIDSGLLATPLPGTTPIRASSAGEIARYERRLADLDRVLALAEVMGCDKIRCFCFRRVAEPASVFGQAAEVIAAMAEIAGKAKVQLVLENESSCNVNTCQEVAAFLPLVPSRHLGFNWDPGNAAHVEKAYPEGYGLLPLARLANVQVKGKGIIPGGPDPVDWKGIFGALRRDGYKGQIGLETHTANRQADSHPAMQELLRLLVGT
jgi:sugar phosphate isomerase/epimerase